MARGGAVAPGCCAARGSWRAHAGRTDPVRRWSLFRAAPSASRARCWRAARALHAAQPRRSVTQRRTPDAADQRHQLYVQWLNAHARDPDVLQLDVVWTPELAAAGWLRALDASAPDVRDFFGVRRGESLARRAVRAAVVRRRRHAVLPPRRDGRAPRTHAELMAYARRASAHGLRYGLRWQAARYEGLVTVFIEYLRGVRRRVPRRAGRVVVESPAGAGRARGDAQRAIAPGGVVPRDAIAWQEEQARFAFQNGHALLMRNWPYAYALMQQPRLAVKGRFACPRCRRTRAAAARRRSADRSSRSARSAINPSARIALIAFLTEPAQMLERARVAGELPARRVAVSLGRAAGALPFDAARSSRSSRARCRGRHARVQPTVGASCKCTCIAA